MYSPLAHLAAFPTSSPTGPQCGRQARAHRRVSSGFHEATQGHPFLLPLFWPSSSPAKSERTQCRNHCFHEAPTARLCPAPAPSIPSLSFHGVHLSLEHHNSVSEFTPAFSNFSQSPLRGAYFRARPNTFASLQTLSYFLTALCLQKPLAIFAKTMNE